MQTTLLTFSVFSMLVLTARGQGVISFDNLDNTSSSVFATSNGLFFYDLDHLIKQDFNAALYGGTDSANLSLIVSISGAAAIGSNAGGPGTFVDMSGQTYPVPGTTTASMSAFFKIEAWIGPYSSYSGALVGGGVATQSPIFRNPVASAPNTPPDLTGMPAIVFVPEPATIWLASLGSALPIFCGMQRFRRYASVMAAAENFRPVRL